MEMQARSVIGRRYELLQSSGSGFMGVVYRARDLLTGSIVALKRVEFAIPAQDFSTSNSPLDLKSALAREFRVLASLRHPNIISVLDYGFDSDRRPYFTMEYLTSAQTVVEYSAGKPIEVRRRLVAEMLEALTYLHRHGVLHCDLKPDNVLMTGDGVVKLLDFGLATAREAIFERDGASYGTLPYAAPELLVAMPNSELSDLYAAGMVAYEILTGEYPFSLTGSIDELIDSIRSDPIDFDKIEDAPLRPFVARLLERAQQNRYQSAEEARADFARLIGQPIHETPSVRESYLQAARFVGRSQELRILSDALRSAIDHVGSAWLIGGESGVGKSRLMEEVRIRALVREAVVLRGQATVERGAPYSLWRDALRVLALRTPLTKFEASIIKPVVPDLEALLGMTIPDAPEIDPTAAQDRLMLVVEDMFRRQPDPLVLMLEDLHWSTEDLPLLQRIAKLAPSARLLVIGTYRNDERPMLPQELPAMTPLHLHRFTQTEVEQLSAAILGDEAGKRMDMIALLLRETEGNAFFIVQVLRALAEETGRLQALGQTALPQMIVAGGMQAVIEGRLNRIQPKDRGLLGLAAVAGRQLDLKLLTALAPSTDMDQWLLDCGSVLEVSDNQWRFAHDKLREGVLRQIDSADRTALHGQVAAALYDVYGDAPDKIAPLAYHYTQAGDSQRGAHYNAMAGEQLLKQGSYRQALEALERAESLSQSLEWTPLARARLARNIAETVLGVGDGVESIEQNKRALRLLGIPTPSETQPNPDIAGAAQAYAAGVGVPLGGKRSDDLETTRFITDIELDITYHYFENTLEPAGGLIYAFSAAARLETTPLRTQLANSYAMLAVVLITCGIPDMAAPYAERAAALLETEEGDDATRANAYSNLAYYWTFAARWEESVRDGDRACDLYQRIGDPMRWRGTLMNLAVSNEWRGDIEGGLALRQQEFETAVRADSILGKIRAMAGIGQMQAYLGRTQEAIETFIERRRLIELANAITSTRWTYLGMAHWRNGDLETAREYLPRAAKEIASIVIPSAHDMFAITNTAEVALALWEYDAANADAYRSHAAAAIRLIVEYGERYLSGRPLMNIFAGRYEWLRGESASAMAIWEHTIQLSEQLGTRLAAALAHYEIGRHLPHGAERTAHLETALRLFHEMGTTWDAKRAQAALAE